MQPFRGQTGRGVASSPLSSYIRGDIAFGNDKVMVEVV